MPGSDRCDSEGRCADGYPFPGAGQFRSIAGVDDYHSSLVLSIADKGTDSSLAVWCGTVENPENFSCERIFQAIERSLEGTVQSVSYSI